MVETDYIVQGTSRNNLRKLARNIRKMFGLDNELYFPIVESLDVFSEVFRGFSYEIVEDSELPRGVHADTDVRTGHIRIKESIYERACDGAGRDRMTIAHEIGHYLTLCVCGFKLQRNYEPEKEIPAYKNPEWQAKCFAGELMIPAHLVKGMNAVEISIKCGVSLDAANVQWSHLKKEKIE